MQSPDNDDSWSIANIEEQYIDSIERQRANYEAQYLDEQNTSIRNLFHNFQESATSIAQLYKGKDVFLCVVYACIFTSFFFFFFLYTICCCCWRFSIVSFSIAFGSRPFHLYTGCTVYVFVLYVRLVPKGT